MAARTPLVRTVDLNVGESVEVALCDGSRATLKFVTLNEMRDAVRNAVRSAVATVEVNGQRLEVESGNYNLPMLFAGVQIDCPITKGYLSNANQDPWRLEKDGRFRLWPGDSPLLAPGTFVYPVTQKWFAGSMQAGNEPVYVDGVERPTRERIYYHDGVDFGGAERDIHILSATDGLVIVSGNDVLGGGGEDEAKIGPGYDRILIRDDQGWYVQYDHVLDIEPSVRPGTRVTMGQRIGLLGKEGGSGGWSHLHFNFVVRQPSGHFGTELAYAYVWEAWQRQHAPHLIAVARPHRYGVTGEAITLDGTRSWSRDRSIEQFEWTFTTGGSAAGAKVQRVYDRPGVYPEILKVTNKHARVAYDIAVVEILNKADVTKTPPGIHAAYSPTMNIRPGHLVTFQARSFGTTFGQETWDFGDGSPTTTTQSDGNAVKHAKDGYGRVTHSFAKPGTYFVSVQRSNERNETAISRLLVEVT